MAEKITTLHPLGDPSTDIYPNIKADSIIDPIPTERLASHIYEHSITLRTAHGYILFTILCNRETGFITTDFAQDVYAIVGGNTIIATGTASNERETFLISFIYFGESNFSVYDATRNVSRTYGLGEYGVMRDYVRRLI